MQRVYTVETPISDVSHRLVPKHTSVSIRAENVRREVCKPTGSKTCITYACLSRESCGGCPAGQECREDHTLCNGEPCAQQRCVNPTNDQCGGCPARLKCQYISTGCPKAQCSPPKYRCISAGAVEGQCSPVSSGFSLDYI